MKTIISILEVVLYNLFPPTLAAPVMMILKDVFPLIGVVIARVGIYMISVFQNLTHHITFRQEEEIPMPELEKI